MDTPTPHSQTLALLCAFLSPRNKADLRGFGLAQTVLLLEDLGVSLQVFSNLLRQRQITQDLNMQSRTHKCNLPRCQCETTPPAAGGTQHPGALNATWLLTGLLSWDSVLSASPSPPNSISTAPRAHIHPTGAPPIPPGCLHSPHPSPRTSPRMVPTGSKTT